MPILPEASVFTRLSAAEDLEAAALWPDRPAWRHFDVECSFCGYRQVNAAGSVFAAP
ncbi:MAG: hypothetical protein FJZ00_04045 [Candidatus Sericytochromatia bacterium]|uniref:Uncharacterized protein n=1 Tax=Candidatus Tanganyikabacteria bacterium TaxID=2961651 RepID=A0A937X3V4_9BACT|nr:hypothetical protein [Candidatus Tanganyikabacteria bacterium]